LNLPPVKKFNEAYPPKKDQPAAVDTLALARFPVHPEQAFSQLAEADTACFT